MISIFYSTIIDILIKKTKLQFYPCLSLCSSIFCSQLLGLLLQHQDFHLLLLLQFTQLAQFRLDLLFKYFGLHQIQHLTIRHFDSKRLLIMFCSLLQCRLQLYHCIQYLIFIDLQFWVAYSPLPYYFQSAFIWLLLQFSLFLSFMIF